MYSVYILECQDGTLYTGITNNLEKRLLSHQAGTASRYTRARGFKKLLYIEDKKNRALASTREYEIKQLSRSQKIELIKSAENKVKRLQK